jgi:hypothetical protein
MVDVSDRLVAATKQFVATPDPVREAQLLLVIGGIKEAASELGEVSVRHVVNHVNRPGILEAVARLLRTQVSLWEALANLPEEQAQYRPVRDALADAMDELYEVAEVAAFKIDAGLSGQLRHRLASLTNAPAEDGDDWRATLAAL